MDELSVGGGRGAGGSPDRWGSASHWCCPSLSRSSCCQCCEIKIYVYFLVKSEENVSLIKGTEIHRILSRNANMTPSLEYIYIKVCSFFTTCTSGGGSCFHNGSKSSYRNLYSLLSPGPFFSFTRGNTGVWERKIVFIKYYQLHSTSRRNKKVLKVLMEWGEGKIRRKLSAQYVSVYSGR